jgi:hypothetical protein
MKSETTPWVAFPLEALKLISQNDVKLARFLNRVVAAPIETGADKAKVEDIRAIYERMMSSDV